MELLLKAGADKAMKYDEKTAAEWADINDHADLAAYIDNWKPTSTVSLVIVSFCCDVICCHDTTKFPFNGRFFDRASECLP